MSRPFAADPFLDTVKGLTETRYNNPLTEGIGYGGPSLMKRETIAARERIRKAVRPLRCHDPECGHESSAYAETCEQCGSSLTSGVVFSAAQSGTAQHEWLSHVQTEIEKQRKCHLHDVGTTMEEFAREFDAGINWDRILDRPDQELRFRRAQAFGEITQNIRRHSKDLHILACHMTFRWQAYLMRGFDPHLASGLRRDLRLFLTVIDGVQEVHDRLVRTDWGDRRRLELALSRDEEVFITGLLADTFRRPHYVVARQEPADNMAQLILRPWRPRIYLSFPITAFKDRPRLHAQALREIESLRDTLRQWAVVFDPYAIKDYDLTYQVPEMKEIAKELGEQTEHGDFRFIDQSEIIVAFFPRAVPSKGVEAELRHARTTGKIIYLCYPRETGGPFSVAPDYFAPSLDKFKKLLRSHLRGLDKATDE